MSQPVKGRGTPRGLDGTKLIEIGIPAYNEEEVIGDVIKRARSALEELGRGFRFRLVVVDDGSKDGTGDIAKALGAIVLRHEENRGYGASVRALLFHALRTGADALVLLDADGQHPPEEIPKLLVPVLRGEADVVIGSRFLLGGARWVPSLRRAGRKFYSLLVSAITGIRLTDVTSGFRAMNRRAIELVAPVYPDDYPAVKVTIYMALRGLRIIELPVRMEPRKSGSSYIRGKTLLSYHVRVLGHVAMALAGR